MLSNAYFLAKFRFDTAENEPAKNLQNFEKQISLPAASSAGDLLERCQAGVAVVLAEAGRHDDAHARGPLGDHRIADRRCEDALLKQLRAESLRLCFF